MRLVQVDSFIPGWGWDIPEKKKKGVKKEKKEKREKAPKSGGESEGPRIVELGSGEE